MKSEFIRFRTDKQKFHFSATTKSLAGMLIGRFLVGTGMGLGPPVAALYVTEVFILLILCCINY